MSTFLNIAGFIIGLVGLIASYVFYRMSVRVKELIWSIRSNNLVQESISNFSNLKIFYKDQPVTNLTVSKIALWNKGLEVIDHQDILTINPLRVVIKDGCEILDASVLKSNNTSSNFSVNLSRNNNCVYILFDYMGNNHGSVIQVIHTGISSSDIDILGDIKGVDKMIVKTYHSSIRDEGRDISRDKARKNALMFTGFGLLFLLFFICTLIPGLVEYKNPSDYQSALILRLSSLFFVAFFVLSAYIKYWSKLWNLPRGLEVFADDIVINENSDNVKSSSKK